MSHYQRQASRGFALLEVMIAAVVMAFGLLALASLQSSVVRASTQSKARSVALSLAKDKLESLRSFSDISGYLELTDQSDATVAGSPIGGVDYTMGWQVARYALSKTTGDFSFVSSDTGVLDPASYEKDAEFKRVAVSVNWTDTAGTTQTVTLEDAIGALNPEDSARLAKVNRGAGPRTPVVMIKDPGTEGGVIPIAIGDGSETAATNPKPIVLSRTGEQTVETRFDVLTYSALNDGSDRALAQARVETAVVGCTCTKAAPTTAVTGYRPTYWDGTRYVAPERASKTAQSKAKSGAVQSPYCDICCRDHNDDGIAASAPKYTPVGDHTHYKPFDDIVGEWEEAAAGDDYVEACRLIRVDGIFDVAADLSNDYFNLLKTKSLDDPPKAEVLGPPFPDGYDKQNPAQSAEQSYEAFALRYLKNRFVPANAPPPAAAAAVYNNPGNGEPEATASTYHLDEPVDPVQIDKVQSLKWLHARGLYVDYLEPPAVAAVTNARENCKELDGTPKTGDDVRDCILRVLPFTSINLSELARWRTTSNREIGVSNNFFSSQPTAIVPVRGMVTPGPAPDLGGEAIAAAGSSNSGVAVFASISPQDQAGIKSDRQKFTFQAGPAEEPGDTFYMQIVDGGNDSFIRDGDEATLFTYPSGSQKTCSSDKNGNTNGYPRYCTTLSGQTLPSTVQMIFGNYNRKSVVPRTVVCGNANKRYDVQMPYVTNYKVTSITRPANQYAVEWSVTDPTPQEPAKVGSGVDDLGEYVIVNVPNVGSEDAITAELDLQDYRYPKEALCGGGGNNSFIGWSEEYVTSSSKPEF